MKENSIWGKRRNYMMIFGIKEYPRELPNNTTYLCAGEDTTEGGKYHCHAFVYFKDPENMACMKKLFGNSAHLEVPRSDINCINYILDTTKRKHDFHEYGERPM